METDFLSKSEVRGKRSTKTKTTHRFSVHSYDDMKAEKGGRRGHSRYTESEDDFDSDIEDVLDIDPSFNWDKIR